MSLLEWTDSSQKFLLKSLSYYKRGGKLLEKESFRFSMTVPLFQTYVHE